MLSDADFQELTLQFPPITFAFAYGSGVIEQGGYDYNKDNKDNNKGSKSNSNPMVDMIFVVDNPEEWHSLNLKLNPSHYSTLFPFSSSFITKIQDSFGARIWYNAMIEMKITNFPTRLMKYGVISKQAIIQDLTQWDRLYTAGRLHKPVKIFKTNQEVENALILNRQFAINTSLLLLPNSFREIDLYYTVASLSYIGDPRMFIGE